MRFKNLRNALNDTGMTKEELTKLFNASCNPEDTVNYFTMCRWLRGDSEPKFRQAGTLCRIFGKTFEELFDEE